MKSKSGFGLLGVIGIIAILGVLSGLGYIVAKTSNDKIVTKVMTDNKDGGGEKMDKEIANSDKNDAMMDKGSSTNALNDEAVMKNDEIKKNESVLVKKAGSYSAYDESMLAQVQNGEHIVIFFYAAWCPTCRAAA